jgi:hypothetical protein
MELRRFAKDVKRIKFGACRNFGLERQQRTIIMLEQVKRTTAVPVFLKATDLQARWPTLWDRCPG